MTESKAKNGFIFHKNMTYGLLSTIYFVESKKITRVYQKKNPIHNLPIRFGNCASVRNET